MVWAGRWLEDKGRLIVLAVLPVLVWTIDCHGSNEHFTFCLLRNITGRDCYGCGFLRGLSAFLHLDFRQMVRLNRLNLVTVPLLGCLYCKELYLTYRKKSYKPLH